MGRRPANRVYHRFERWGFGAVAVPALLSPPFPIIPFLLAVGAMPYSRRKFLAALTWRRGLRYSIRAYLGLRYGDSLVAFIRQVHQAHHLPARDNGVGGGSSSVGWISPPSEAPLRGRCDPARVAPGQLVGQVCFPWSNGLEGPRPSAPSVAPASAGCPRRGLALVVRFTALFALLSL